MQDTEDIKDPTPNTIIILDIETSGLDAQEDHITCIGCLDPERGITQFTHSAEAFRTEPLMAEKDILEHFFAYYHPKMALITYNGVKFDVPFILARAELHDIDHEVGFPPKSHIDLSRFVKHVSKHYTSKDTAARNTAGLYVPNTIAGSFLARIYKHKTVTDEQHLEMLQHNSIDLAATAKMHAILHDYKDFDEWLLEESAPKRLVEQGR